MDFFVNADEHAEISAMSWETAIQKHVEEELSASSIEVVDLFLPYNINKHLILYFWSVDQSCGECFTTLLNFFSI